MAREPSRWAACQRPPAARCTWRSGRSQGSPCGRIAGWGGRSWEGGGGSRPHKPPSSGHRRPRAGRQRPGSSARSNGWQRLSESPSRCPEVRLFIFWSQFLKIRNFSNTFCLFRFFWLDLIVKIVHYLRQVIQMSFFSFLVWAGSESELAKSWSRAVFFISHPQHCLRQKITAIALLG